MSQREPTELERLYRYFSGAVVGYSAGFFAVFAGTGWGLVDAVAVGIVGAYLGALLVRSCGDEFSGDFSFGVFRWVAINEWWS